MDFLTLGKILVRRWYLTVPMVLLTALVGAAVVRSVDSEFEATGSFVLLGPREHVVGPGAPEGTEPAPRNPYTEFTPSLTTAAGALEVVLEDGDLRSRLRELRLSDEVEVTAADDAPTLEVTVSAARAEVAVETLDTVFSMMGDDLRERQDAAGAPENLQITVQSLVLPDQARELTAARDRALVAFSVLGLVATVGLAVVADAMANARRERARRAGLEDVDGLVDVRDAEPSRDPDEPVTEHATNGWPRTPAPAIRPARSSSS